MVLTRTPISGVAFTGSSTSIQGRLYESAKKILMSPKYGLTLSQATTVINKFKALGKVPTSADLASYARALNPTFGKGTATIKPVILPEVDNLIQQSTGLPVQQMNTGFAVIDPTQETFIQKNKAWLVPVGIGAAALTVYLIIKKKK